jgi:glutaconate CoA-transferase subunit B
VFVIMPQKARSFVDELHFRTSPGHSGDAKHDADRGWLGAGPSAVITDLGEYRFDEQTGEMTLQNLHPGVTVDDVRENTGWEMKISDGLGETPPPTGEELRLIREELDPEGVYSR